MFIHPSYTLFHPLEPTLYHPHPPTHLFPLSSTNYPLPAESRFTIIHPHSLSIWVPLRSAPQSDLQLIQRRCRRAGGGEAPALLLSPFISQMYEGCPHTSRRWARSGTRRNRSRVMLKLRSVDAMHSTPSTATFLTAVARFIVTLPSHYRSAG